MAVDSVDFNVTQALLGQGFDVSAVPALASFTEQSRVSPCSVACNSLEYVYGQDAVNFNGDAEYNNFTATFWSDLQAETNPYCVFYPSSQPEVSVAVLLSRLTQCPFAVRSGGHAAFSGGSNIEGGITVSMRNLNRITLSDDKKTAHIQPGNTWNRIYNELQPYDLAAIGGRVADIGVGGLTTGGGISFFSNVYGLACDNVASYQVVIANGQVVTASPSQNSDLYWALRGGGNNFGIVVDFELETIPLPGGEMWGGTRIYLEDQFSAVTDAFLDLVDESPSDPEAGAWLTWVINNGVKVAAPELWYGKPDGRDAPIFDKFNNITAISDTTQSKTLAAYSVEVADQNPYGFRECYYVMSIKASRTVARAATDLFFEAAASVQDIPGVLPVMVWQGVAEGVLSATKKNGGNPLGLRTEDGPYYIIEISVRWDNEQDDERVYQMASSVLEKVKAQAVSEGVQNDWVYMNYASKFQDVVSSYGAGNKAALKKIASKYDPTQVFQKLQPGYFKLDRAPVPGTSYFSY